MEHMETVPFSSLIAGMLLCNKKISSADVVNVISDICNHNIYIDDEDDDLSILFSCVSVNSNYTSFCLKDGLDYSSILYDDVTVYDYLVSQSNNAIFSYLGIGTIKKRDINNDDSFNKRKSFNIRLKKKTRRQLAV